jgi:hypothetical protein
MTPVIIKPTMVGNRRRLEMKAIGIEATSSTSRSLSKGMSCGTSYLPFSLKRFGRPSHAGVRLATASAIFFIKIGFIVSLRV